jgi:16S rRNA (cytosine967-C5)-methyltransferase
MPEDTLKRAPHGIHSLLRILAYSKYVENGHQGERMVSWARQILGWRELQSYEEYMARLVSGKARLTYGGLPEYERLTLETCHPAWYVARLVRIFGRDFALRILKRDLHPLPAFARVNRLIDDDEDLVPGRLQGSKVAGVMDAYRLDKTRRPEERTKLSASGKIILQDLASIVAGLAAAPKPGQTVLDVCSAPGNKTTHLAAQMNNEGKIYSIDLSNPRLLQWKRETTRAGSSIAMPIQADARSLPLNNSADVVFVDPPCSNSGVFARNPASKWKITPALLRELVSRQSAILQSASEHLRTGGTLVYCTCSILPEENESVIGTFVEKNPEFEIVVQDPFIGSPGLRGFTKCQRFYSHLHDCNGQFIAKLQRSG